VSNLLRQVNTEVRDVRGKTPRAQPTQVRRLEPLRQSCVECGHRLWQNETKHRTVATLEGVVGLEVHVRMCPNRACGRYHLRYHPEAEGALVLPHYEYGLDVLTLIGALRYREHQSVPQIHAQVRARGVSIGQRNITYLLERYDELVALAVDRAAQRERLGKQGRAIIALDGLQPEVGHEVLWVIRELLCGEILLARPLLSSSVKDLVGLLQQATAELGVPVVGVVSDGQESIRSAVAKVFPDTPHQLCHFHYFKHAALAVYEADRHAKKELKKHLRGVRPVERAVEGREDEQAEIVRGYCAAVRSALTDDGRPPLVASGLKLHERLSAIEESLERAEQQKGGCQSP
jgi:Transposase, Mutator family